MKNDPGIVNPVFAGSATLSDICPGIGLLRVFFRRGFIQATVVENSPLEGWRVHHAARQAVLCLFPPRSGGYDQWFLDRSGVVPYEDGRWTDDCVTIVNTALNRDWLMQWLFDRDDQGSDRAVGEIILHYPEHYVSVATLKKLTARLMKHE